MMCQRQATFRLLDARVGWDLDTSEGAQPDGTGDDACLVLAPTHPDEVSEEDVLPWFLPPWLARGPRGCEWLLAPGAGQRRLLRREPGGSAFEPWGPELCRVDAVASDCYRWIALADGVTGEVQLLDAVGRPAARIPVSAPEALALTRGGEVLVAAGHRVWRFGVGGEPRGRLGAMFHRVVSMRVDRQGRIWVVSRDAAGRLRLARFQRTGARLRRADPALLPQVFPPTGVRVWSATGVCWSPKDAPVAPCIGRDGRPLDEEAVAPFGRRERERGGTLVTGALDSGEPRTLWHRVRLDADVPPGTQLLAAVATVDAPTEPVPEDGWFAAPPGALDFLCTAPPGRYLKLKLELRGEDDLTPRVRQVRLDFPRVTSADLLPAVYLEAPRAADFTRRFLAMFDAELERMDTAIQGFPALLSADRAPPEVLSWLGGFLGLAFDASWDAERQRAFLREAPALFRARGTPQGLRRALTLACGAEPALLEPGNPFGAVGRTCVVGATRLHGRNRGRLRLDRSTLGQSTLRSFGNPDADPLREAAYRFTILFPPGVARTGPERQRLEALVQALKPAHTVALVRFGGGFVVGTSSAVGIDTALLPPPAPVLGTTTRLSATVLGPSPQARSMGLRVDAPIVGVTTSF
ncbi:phage tail protein [Pyxidicoccus xibeiensis]|uniref:phage tail protein n=1 Tax=Pyxidicoccus xibeiensis TaxID=2906759 RepID=UPI0020A73D5F|nr:phage tail protein [Pyxidicoccus xibeiensis]MCP3143388.1 phage tail protein [Pyxidicoccus xibeiensis]